MEFSWSKVFRYVVFIKEKVHVRFWRCGINGADATPTFPLTVPIILDHPVYQCYPNTYSLWTVLQELEVRLRVTYLLGLSLPNSSWCKCTCCTRAAFAPECSGSKDMTRLAVDWTRRVKVGNFNIVINFRDCRIKLRQYCLNLAILLVNWDFTQFVTH